MGVKIPVSQRYNSGYLFYALARVPDRGEHDSYSLGVCFNINR